MGGLKVGYEILAGANGQDYTMSFSLNTITRVKDNRKFAVTASESGVVWFLDGYEKVVIDRIFIFKNNIIEKDFLKPIEAYDPEIRAYIDRIFSGQEVKETEEKTIFKSYWLPNGREFKVHEKGFAIVSDGLGHEIDITLSDAERIVDILELTRGLKKFEKLNKDVSIQGL